MADRDAVAGAHAAEGAPAGTAPAKPLPCVTPWMSTIWPATKWSADKLGADVERRVVGETRIRRASRLGSTLGLGHR
ncbi:hypothetical protein [Paracoccus sp. (in: a-proteobacteria)]|uniref:hypothetical protein n=1 Tax=Paracoccus sp. TaxID=267 RepID=UPI002AFEE9CD|nr:hypothetical protein [Paracoccus sp. (in: a-proteobacteria)]